MIKRIVDRRLQFTSHICSGIITLDAILQEIGDSYVGDITPHQLWDFSDARIVEMEPGQIKTIAEHANNHSARRPGGKTAIVAGMKNKFTHVRMYELIIDMVGTDVETRVFRIMDDALSWIRECDADQKSVSFL